MKIDKKNPYEELKAYNKTTLRLLYFALILQVISLGSMLYRMLQ